MPKPDPFAVRHHFRLRTFDRKRMSANVDAKLPPAAGVAAPRWSSVRTFTLLDILWRCRLAVGTEMSASTGQDNPIDRGPTNAAGLSGSRVDV